MTGQQLRKVVFGTQGAALMVVAVALGLAACGPSAGNGVATASAAAAQLEQPSPAPVPTYYLDQTYAAVGEESSPRKVYLGWLHFCLAAHLPATPLSAPEVAKLATKRVRTWQRPGHSVVQRDTWRVIPSSDPKRLCAFGGIQEESIREVRVLPQTLYVMDLTKGTVRVQTQAGPPTSLDPPITVAQVKQSEAVEAERGIMKRVGTSTFLGEPCAILEIYKPNGSAAYTECGWTGGLANGVPPKSLVLWRKPATTGAADEWAITATTFLVGHLPPGSDAVFKVPGKAGPAATAGAKP